MIFVRQQAHTGKRSRQAPDLDEDNRPPNQRHSPRLRHPATPDLIQDVSCCNVAVCFFGVFVERAHTTTRTYGPPSPQSSTRNPRAARSISRYGRYGWSYDTLRRWEECAWSWEDGQGGHAEPSLTTSVRVNLRTQKRLAASVMECGKRKVWLDPNEMNEISNANSRSSPPLPPLGLFETAN